MQNPSSLRSMSISAIIDRTFRLYRQNFKDIILFSLFIGGTASLVTMLLNVGITMSAGDILFNPLLDIIDGTDLIDSLSYLAGLQSALTSGIFYTLISIITGLFVYPIVYGGLSMVTLSAVFEEEEKNFFRRVMSMYWKLFYTQFASGVMVILLSIALIILIAIIIIPITLISAGGSFTGAMIFAVILILVVSIAFIALFTFFLLVFPVAVHEQTFGFKAVGRAWSLFRRRFWKSFGLLVLSTLIVSVLSAIISSITSFLPLIVGSVTSTVLTAFLTPVITIAFALLYVDIRITVEGYDLELRASMLGGNLDDSINA